MSSAKWRTFCPEGHELRWEHPLSTICTCKPNSPLLALGQEFVYCFRCALRYSKFYFVLFRYNLNIVTKLVNLVIVLFHYDTVHSERSLVLHLLDYHVCVVFWIWVIYPFCHWIFQPDTNINPLRPSNAICRHRSMSTLVQVMAWSLTAPRHYLNQSWLIISNVP